MTTTVERPLEPEVAAAPRPKAFSALAGLLAGAGALVSAELVGRIVPGGVSPVYALGNRVVELTPDSLRQASISAFGTLDTSWPVRRTSPVLTTRRSPNGCFLARPVRRVHPWRLLYR